MGTILPNQEISVDFVFVFEPYEIAQQGVKWCNLVFPFLPWIKCPFCVDGSSQNFIQL